MSDIWTPHLTVAAIIERDGRFLMVEEAPDGVSVFNQPAGHVEENEFIHAAVIREVLEETGCHFTAEAITGIYRWRSPRNAVTYLRIAICGQCTEPTEAMELDPDIINTHWFTMDELRERNMQLRSPLVMRGFEDYLRGQRYSLDLVQEL